MALFRGPGGKASPYLAPVLVGLAHTCVQSTCRVSFFLEGLCLMPNGFGFPFWEVGGMMFRDATTIFFGWFEVGREKAGEPA